jgi:aspartate ammonia-lyase
MNTNKNFAQNDTAYRIESDSIGSKKVPVDAYYGVQSLRGEENFPITGNRLHPEMIRSLARLKKACAIANAEAGMLDEKVAKAIERLATASSPVSITTRLSWIPCREARARPSI